MTKAIKKDKRVSHGILHYIETGKFHPTQKKRKLLSKELERLRDLAKAQTPDMNVKKEMLINDAIFCQGIMDLAMMYINKAGLFKQKDLERGQLEMHPTLMQVSRFMSVKRMNLMAVGLSSSTDETQDVQAYIKAFDEKAKKGRPPKK